MSLLKKILNPFTLAFIIFLISSVYITYPLIFHLGDLVTGYGDQYLISWIMNWNIHQLFINPLDLFNANIYYPYKNSLAFSETFLTSSVLSIIPMWLLKEPIVTVNFTLISSIFMVGFFTFILSFYLTKNFWASLISGLLIIFSPVFLDKKTHIQMLSIQWIPLSILFFIMLTKSFKPRYLLFSMLFFLLQFYNSFLPGYFLIFFYLIYLFFIFIKDKNKIIKLFTKTNFLILLSTFVLMIPIIKPYYDVFKEYNAARNIRDAIHFALQPEDLIYPNEHTVLEPLLLQISNIKQYKQTDEIKSGYIGLVFTLLSLLTIFYAIKKINKKNILENSFLTAGLLGLILSFGPALHFARETIHKPFVIILPYAIFYYIIPGFSGFRNSSRWEMLFIFSIAILISIVLPSILKNNKKSLIIYLLLIVGIVAEYNFPMKFYPVTQVKDFAQSYKWLSNTPKNSIYITMPIHNWNSPNYAIELEREYYSTQNFRKTVNGYSGFSPFKWQEDILYLFSNFPENESILRIKKMGVNYIIVNKNEYDSLYKNKYYLLGDGDYVIKELNDSSEIELKEKFEDTYVYGFNN